jgi:hypothetical protein
MGTLFSACNPSRLYDARELRTLLNQRRAYLYGVKREGGQ